MAKKETRGRKPKAKRALPAIPTRPPANLKTQLEHDAWSRVRRHVLTAGLVQSVDAEALASVARLMAQADKLALEIASLGTMMVPAGNGAMRVHPLIAEQRATERTLLAMLAQFLLTPRARASARLSSVAQDEARDRAAMVEQEGDDILRLIG